jgi:hypothetical protein
MMCVAASVMRESSLGKVYIDALDYVMKTAEVCINGRYIRKAGVAEYKINKFNGQIHYIRMAFAEKIFNKFTAEQRQDTVSHEMAHLVEAVVHFTSDHGVRWQHIHRALGGTAQQFCKVDNGDDLFNRVKRIKMLDTLNNKEYLVTTGKWFKYSTNYPQRFKRLSTVIKVGAKIVEELPY